MWVGIKEAAQILGVRAETLRRWEREGKLKPSERTVGGHRRYDIGHLPQGKRVRFSGEVQQRKTIGYARVSSSDQREDLARQIHLLETYCAAQGWKFEIIDDLGSGLNYQKRGLRRLIREICSNQVGRLVLTHKDRLLRFGSELIFSLCDIYGTEIVIIGSSQELSFEEELSQDVLEIITVFSARLYGARSKKNQNLLKTLKDAAHETCG